MSKRESVVRDRKERAEKEHREPAPKKPMSSFFQFRGQVFKRTKEQNSDKKVSQVMKIIADMWKGLDEDKKKEYSAQYDAERKVYDQKMEEYMKKHKMTPKSAKSNKGTSKKVEEYENQESDQEDKQVVKGKGSEPIKEEKSAKDEGKAAKKDEEEKTAKKDEKPLAVVTGRGRKKQKK